MTRKILSYLLWPALLISGIAITQIGFDLGHPMIGFNAAYALIVIALLVLERRMPHEEQWKASDGQFWADIGHTLVSKGAVQAVILFGGIIGLSEIIKPSVDLEGGLWPTHWPQAAQIVLALIVAEFGLYWAHRIAHEWKPLWPFHAIHHSVERLWVVNTGRFHFVDTLVSIILGIGCLLIAGAPLEMIQWLSAVTAFIGVLTHCNIEMRFGFLSWIFNTPELHRWHHSRDLSEGNRNYGENLMLWDHVFRSYFRDEKRRPPVNVGLPEQVPQRFIKQLSYPFHRLRTYSTWEFHKE
ncbi:MAG: sterol desaturase family protein [Pseudobdellovibrionaceae bacterium]